MITAESALKIYIINNLYSMKVSYEANKKIINVQTLRHLVQTKTLNLEVMHTELYTNQQNYTLYTYRKSSVLNTLIQTHFVNKTSQYKY